MARHEIVSLLRALPMNRTVVLSTAGFSMWPVLRSGDQVLVSRTPIDGLRPGDLAVVCYAGNLLVVHFVSVVEPFQTVSAVGIPDPPPLEVFARVVAVRRNGVTIPIPRVSRHLLRHVPTVAKALKRIPGTRSLVRLLRGR